MQQLKRLAIVAAATASIAALNCAAATAAEPVRGGTLTQIIPTEPPTFDCHATQTSFVMQAVGPSYSSLLKIDPAQYPKIVGDLAESWDVSADGLVYTLKLRQGVTFHDGSTFDANDAKATFDRIMSPPDGVVSVRRSELVDVASVDVVDPYTIRFTLKQRNVAFANVLANPWHCIYSAEKLKENPNYPATEVMGTGPFQFVEYVKGSHWLAKRFDNYFVAGKPYVDEIRSNFVGGPALIPALAAGQADAMYWFVTPPQQARIAEVQGDKMVFDESPLNSLVFITFNTSKPPFNDARVRRALSISLDRHEADAALSRVSALKGATAYFAPGSEFTSTPEELAVLPGYGNDIEAARTEAKKLLAEAGVPNLKFTITTRNLPPFEPPTIFPIDQWRKIGVEVEVTKLDTAPYFAALNETNFEAAVEGYNFNNMDPNDVFQKFLPGSSINFAKNSDDVLVDLYQKQKVETDPAKRRDLAQQYQKRLLEEAYYAPILWNRRITVNKSNVKGWHNTPVFAVGADLADIWIEK
ncbi:MAG: ABC transporter substrate-binding protein [Rhizobiaceae bacterium]|nr:ABC transporter substrate-binding protein [Rhizobiaceae bacterium]